MWIRVLLRARNPNCEISSTIAQTPDSAGKCRELLQLSMRSLGVPVVLLDSLLVPVILVMALFILAAGRVLLHWARGYGRLPEPGRPAARQRGLGSTATEELHALIYPSKRAQLEQRRMESVLRDDEHEGAPPRSGIDLDAGTATIRPRDRS